MLFSCVWSRDLTNISGVSSGVGLVKIDLSISVVSLCKFLVGLCSYFCFAAINFSLATLTHSIEVFAIFSFFGKVDRAISSDERIRLL